MSPAGYCPCLSYLFSKAGLFSAVSSAFVIDAQSKLEPDPNDQTAILLRAILLTLNQSAIQNETPIVPPVQQDPPTEIVTATGLMYASLLISLLAAFIAMLSKQWLNRYLRHAGGSVIERCGDRQRKCDGLEKWPFHLFVESLPIMLQVSLLLLTCGLCRNVWSTNTSVASILITLTVLGILFYLGIVIVGTSSYECPFQTPASTALRGMWKKVQPRATLLTRPIVVAGAHAYWALSSKVLQPLWKEAVFPAISTACRFGHAAVQAAMNLGQQIHVTFRSCQHTHHPSPAVSLEEIREDPHVIPESDPSPHDNTSPHGSDFPTRDTGSSRRNSSSLSQETGSSSRDAPRPTPGNIGPWLAQDDLATIQRANARDIRCVSWILWNITDPEALDAAIRLASMIRWFEDGNDVEPPYDTIVSTFRACFDSTGAVYPGLLDRAYHSAQTILWVHIRAINKSGECARKFPLPNIAEKMTLNLGLDPLSPMYSAVRFSKISHYSRIFAEGHTRTHIQWASQVLLHFCRTMQEDIGLALGHSTPAIPWNVMPLDAILNFLLVWSIFLGVPVGEEALKIQDKTYVISLLSLQTIHLRCLFSICVGRVASQLSCAIIAAIPASHPHHSLLQGTLLELAKWNTRPRELRAIAYEWCSVICEEYPDLEDAKELLFLSLKIGFGGLDFESWWTDMEIVHTKHHQRMVDIVFNSEDYEVIGNFLHAWTSHGPSHRPPGSLNMCTKYLIGLQSAVSASRRLRCLVIRSVEFAVIRHSEHVGMDELAGLLDCLNIGIDDLGSWAEWLEFLISAIKSPGERRSLPHQYLGLMVELTVAGLRPSDPIDEAQVMISLEEEQGWDVLEYWMGVVWAIRRPKIDGVSEDLERVTLSLFRQRPKAVQKLEQWLQRSDDSLESVECLRWICERAGLGTVLQHDTP